MQVVKLQAVNYATYLKAFVYIIQAILFHNKIYFLRKLLPFVMINYSMLYVLKYRYKYCRYNTFDVRVNLTLN